MKLTGDFCCPPSTALHQTTPNSPRSKFCLALLLPPTSTLDAAEASKHRFSSVARLFPHPSSPSRLSPTGEPPTTTHDVRPCFPQAVTRHDRLFRPPPLDLQLSIVPRITLYSLDQLSVSLAPALDAAARHPAAGFRPVRSLLVGLPPTYITSRLVSDAARSKHQTNPTTTS